MFLSLRSFVRSVSLLPSPASVLVALVILLVTGRIADAATSAPPALRLRVDATDVSRHLLHARLSIPATAGPLTLLYPKWIPGEHSPSGPLIDVAGLHITSGGRDVAWKRDAKELYAFHLEVPKGSREIEVAFDVILPFQGGRRLVMSTPSLAILEWNRVLFYPARENLDALPVQATLELPEGWTHGTVLDAARSSKRGVTFRPVPFTELVDAPVLMGRHLRSIRLAPEMDVPHFIHLAADAPEHLEAPPELIARWETLVREARALFGARHYREYHFLVALSDFMTYGGLEHHESSANRMPARSLLDRNLKLRVATLLSHELAHSWCGKYRRPAGLASRPYLEPMETSLLWVYEGMTEYFAWVLATRSGILTLDESLEDIASTAAYVDHGVGRSWRSLEDVTASTPIFYGAGEEYSLWRRAFRDVYNESILLWLEADAIIRNATQGKRSFDDFCRRFYGGTDGGPAVRTYTLDDVIADLGAVAPYDWRAFFVARATRTSARAPLGGIEGNGWKLVYTDEPSALDRSQEQARRRVNLLYSLGFMAGSDGKVSDVIPGTPAARAGLVPGVTVKAIGGRAWSGEAARAAIRESAAAREKLEILVERGERVSTLRVDGGKGNRHPALRRDPGKPDYLTRLLAPRGREPVLGATSE
ncbi:MAG TPA: M61 family peptidase [Candidatus Eisenbacteria bacterium]|nr:M61 family peptidase [Candidatus Eisenbacteria bacterium]